MMLLGTSRQANQDTSSTAAQIPITRREIIALKLVVALAPWPHEPPPQHEQRQAHDDPDGVKGLGQLSGTGGRRGTRPLVRGRRKCEQRLHPCCIAFPGTGADQSLLG